MGTIHRSVLGRAHHGRLFFANLLHLLYLSMLFLWWQAVTGILGVTSSHALRMHSRCTWPHRAGRAKHRQHRHPPRAQPVAPLRERHRRRPRRPSRRCTDPAPSCDQGQAGGAHARRNDPIAAPCRGMRCSPVSPLFASWPWLPHIGCSLETIDMTVHERNRERGTQ